MTGFVAPPFMLRGRADVRCLAGLRGRTVVLVFAEAWRPEVGDVEALQARLRGVGAAAAIANAVYNATGKRVRDLPITLDKLL